MLFTSSLEQVPGVVGTGIAPGITDNKYHFPVWNRCKHRIPASCGCVLDVSFTISGICNTNGSSTVHEDYQH